MNAVTFKARFDGKHICLDEPCDLPTGTKLLVVVMPDPEETFREEWLALSQQHFAWAYGEDGPDYSRCLSKVLPTE